MNNDVEETADDCAYHAEEHAGNWQRYIEGAIYRRHVHPGKHCITGFAGPMFGAQSKRVRSSDVLIGALTYLTNRMAFFLMRFSPFPLWGEGRGRRVYRDEILL